MWFPGLHLVCVESTSHRPPPLSTWYRMKNMLIVDISKSAAIAVHVMLLSSSGTGPKCSTFLICHGCRRTTASSIPYIALPTANSIHPPANNSIWCNMSVQPFMHEIMTPSWWFPKQEMKSSYVRKFLRGILSPLFSCKWRNKQNLRLTIARHQQCCHTGNFWHNKLRQSTHRTLRSCAPFSKWFLIFWSNMVPVSSWSSSLIVNIKASRSFKTLTLTDQQSTNLQGTL